MKIDEVKSQSAELLALIDSLRPHPAARLTSREQIRTMGTISGDDGLVALADRRDTPDEYTFFWEIDGEYLTQVFFTWEAEIA